VSVELAKRAVACKGWRHLDGMAGSDVGQRMFLWAATADLDDLDDLEPATSEAEALVAALEAAP